MAEAAASTKVVGEEAKRTAASATTASERMVASAHKNKDAWEKSGRAMLLTGAALAAGVAISVKTFMDFDAQMSQVKTLSHATASEMDQLTNAALSMGQGIGFSAKQTAEAETELVKAGLSVKDILGGALVGALNLAAAGQIDVAQATEIAASAMTQFKLSGKDVPHIADLLAAGADKALGGVGDLGSALSSAGTVAHQFGWSLEETVGTLAEFAQNAQIGEKGGTLVRQMLLQLVNPSKQAKAVMDEYNFSVESANGGLIHSSELAGRLQKSFGGLTPAVRTHALAVIFGAHAIQGANILMTDGAKVNANWGTSINIAAFAAQQAAGKMDNLKGDLAKLRAALENDLIKTGSSGNTTLRGMTQAVTKLATLYGGLPKPVQATGLALLTTAAAASLAGGAFLTLTPKIIAVRTALTGVGVSAVRARAALVAVGSGFTVIAAAEAANGIGDWIGQTETATVGTKQMAASLQELAKSGKLGDAGLQSLTVSGKRLSGGLSSSSEALKNFGTDAFNALDQGWDARIGRWQRMGAATSKFNKDVGQLDAGLAELVRTGHADDAATAFQRLTQAAVQQGVPLKVVASQFKQYGAALNEAKDKANADTQATKKHTQATADGIPVTRSMADAMLLLGPSAKSSDKAVQGLAEELDKYQQKVASAFQSSTNVLTSFTIDTGKKAGTAAAQLTASYKTTLRKARAFASDIAAATRRGLDPTIIARLLEAGPAAAGPALRTMVGDHSNRLIRMANQSEKALGNIQARVLEEARLTNLALQSGTDTMTHDLAAAMRITEAEASAGGKATAAALAKQLHIGAGEVKRIAAEFGISIAAGVTSGTTKAGLGVTGLGHTVRGLPTKHAITFSVPGLRPAASSVAAFAQQLNNLPAQKRVQILYAPKTLPGPGIAAPGMPHTAVPHASTHHAAVHPASGGLITGPGTGTSDSIPAMVSNGEYVINAASTARNLPLLRAINADKYADGGMVGGWSSPQRFVSGASTAPQVTVQAPGVSKTIQVIAQGPGAAEIAREIALSERHREALTRVYG
ncbi:phage tail tape measure protein [Angustibacter sp. McL0619]|uniref:phage tail tape measure protein n=1 Tax=Angustibacter sp. McL0619 TaxID=3415676 RepID=UPI003CFABDFC